MTIKRRDTAPPFTATCTDADGDAVDISNATIRFHMEDSSGTVKVDAAADIVLGTAGTVRYDWAAADTDTAGHFKAEVEVTFADGTIRTFPTTNFATVRIIGDII
jgi:phage baseplate assembly protein gpV